MDGKELVERLQEGRAYHRENCHAIMFAGSLLDDAIQDAIAYITAQSIPQAPQEDALPVHLRQTQEGLRARLDMAFPELPVIDKAFAETHRARSAMAENVTLPTRVWNAVLDALDAITPQKDDGQTAEAQSQAPAAPKEYVGWTCGKCGAPVAGGFSKCDKCGRDPKQSTETSITPPAAECEHVFKPLNREMVCVLCSAKQPAEAPTLANETLYAWTHRKLSFEPGNPTHASVSIQDLKEFAAELDRRLSQPATGAGGERHDH